MLEAQRKTMPASHDQGMHRGLLVAIILGSLLILIPVGWGVVRISGLRFYSTTSVSMEKTIPAGNTFVSDTRAYLDRPPMRGDIVTVQHGDYILAKRVIGVPGDRISSRDGVLSVNGEPLQEPYVQHTGPSLDDDVNNFPERVVPPGGVFLAGDNRDLSLDSRMAEFGEAKLADVTGKVVYISHR